MKKVFTDIYEIAHLWASESQNEARNTGNFYFYGLTIYSYGRHFPVAQIYDKDHNIVFFNSAGYSNTTAKHKNAVSYAINHKKVFTLPNVELNTKYKGDLKTYHKSNIVFYLNTIEELIKKQNRARKYNYLTDINKNLTELQNYVKLFSLRSLLSKPEKELLNITDVNDLFVNCDFTQLREKREKQKTAKQIRENKKRLFAWCGCKVPYKQNKVYLRVNEVEQTIETSKSANVPIREAKILYDRINAGKDIKGFKIGYYTVISINGVLKIGCHEIERDEINRIAKILNW